MYTFVYRYILLIDEGKAPDEMFQSDALFPAFQLRRPREYLVYKPWKQRDLSIQRDEGTKLLHVVRSINSFHSIALPLKTDFFLWQFISFNFHISWKLSPLARLESKLPGL